MPSWAAHAAAGIAVASVFRTPGETRRVGWAAVLCTIVPDIDAVGRPFGAGDIELLGGHRGFTHSLAFAAAFGAVVAWGLFRDRDWASNRLRLWICFTLATATHGMLDAMTTRGDGVKFLSPFSATRFEFAWQPIDPHPPWLATREGFSRFYSLIGNELAWVILASITVIVIVSRIRGIRRIKRR